MSGTEHNPAVPAATVIIARDGARGLEVLVIERAAGMGFAGGAIAFPGGKVDATDFEWGNVGEPGKAAATALHFAGFDALPPEEAASRIAAAREAFEETGILLSTGPSVSAETRARLRPLSDRHLLSFGNLLRETGHRLPAAALQPFSRWLPPEGLHKRFDTRFYLATCPAGEAHQADGTEAVHARWAQPAHLLAEADAGQISILFPTRCNLARLAQHGSVEALLADPTPATLVQPCIVASEDGPLLTIPEGIGYPYREELLERARRQ